MNQFTAQQKIELIDRKYNFLMNSSSETFIYDLRNFVQFLKEDEIIRDYIEKISQKFIDDKNTYKEIFEIEKSNLEVYANKESKVGREISNFIYNFDIEETVSPKNSLNRIKDRLEIPTLHIPQDKDEFITSMHKDQMESIMQNLNYEIMQWKILLLTSAGKALDDIEYFLYFATLQYIKSGKKTSENNIFDSIREGMSNKQNAEDINKAIKEGTAYLGYNKMFVPAKKAEEIKEGIELNNSLKNKITRVYETVRQEIGSTRLKLTILDRYKIRSQSYNKDYLKNLSKGIKRKSEELLSKDLSIYLFDQGFPVWYRVRRGQHEYDFIHPDSNNPLLIEIKVCKKTDKKYALQGLKQIHAYLSSCESEFQIYEGFYVIFRLGGAIYEFPRKIITNRFIIYPMVIDLGESLDSGSKQVNPIQISSEEIEKELGQK